MIKKENIFYTFSKNNKPVYRAYDGEIITLETVDAFGGQIKSEEDKLDQLDWKRVNPATGPIYVENAQAGDLLKVDIMAIELDSHGIMASIPGAGIFGKMYESSSIKCFSIENNHTYFNDIMLPLEPMIGVIGVAPETDTPNGEPGPHGGNMDNKMIRVGSSLYLPVFTEGVLFGLGDLHALMSDGEVNVTGIEIGGKVTIKLSLLKGLSHGHPLLIDQDHFYTIYSDKTLEDAVKGASLEMHHWLKDALNYTDSDTSMLMSLMANLEICQVVDPKVTIRMKAPLTYFRQFK
ncbi:acetamidase [Acidaminobacter sp. JC074]|uniref:acetamidase/formamidase family protein n=1 Tax=Acidaminobacter sp. JC074 TaxID=2530199 RepID=UPI001F0CEDF6|nr:acetamidase/formamidase family protein [Acidaminobacter sp. JC074]MCH4889767.1 acetamidase [Acidaminobacter sp. JC074]